MNNGNRAKGKISADSVFDGVIKFYDVSTNKLIEESKYDRGVQNGSDVSYYQNGVIAVKCSYKDGKQDGYSYIYNDKGKLISQNYFYYGIRMGNNAEYSDTGVKKYWFHSLDYGILLYLDYDSIKGRKLSDFQTTFFFYHVKEYYILNKTDSPIKKTEYFLYTPNPPKFDFKYDLVLVDSTRKVLSVLKQFSNSQPWTEFDLDDKVENSNNKRALRLLAMDSINNKTMGAMKVLE